MDPFVFKYETCRTCLKPLQLDQYDGQTREQFNIYRNWRVRNVLVLVPTFRVSLEEEDRCPINVCEECLKQCVNFLQFSTNSANSVKKANSGNLIAIVKKETMEEPDDVDEMNQFPMPVVIKAEAQDEQLVNDAVQPPIEEFTYQNDEFNNNSEQYDQALTPYTWSETDYSYNNSVESEIDNGIEFLPEEVLGTIEYGEQGSQPVVNPDEYPIIQTEEVNETPIPPPQKKKQKIKQVKRKRDTAPYQKARPKKIESTRMKTRSSTINPNSNRKGKKRPVKK